MALLRLTPSSEVSEQPVSDRAELPLAHGMTGVERDEIDSNSGRRERVATPGGRFGRHDRIPGAVTEQNPEPVRRRHPHLRLEDLRLRPGPRGDQPLKHVRIADRGERARVSALGEAEKDARPLSQNGHRQHVPATAGPNNLVVTYSRKLLYIQRSPFVWARCL